MTSSIEKASNYLARESGQDQEILLFGLRLLANTVMGYGLLIVFAYLAGVLYYTLVAAITTSVFRVFSGGAHASSSLRCSVSGLIVFILMGFLARSLQGISQPVWAIATILITLVGIYLINAYAPADTPGKPITSQAQRQTLRAISFALILAWGALAMLFILMPSEYITLKTVASSSIGLIWQLLTIAPLGYRLVAKMDDVLRHWIP